MEFIINSSSDVQESLTVLNSSLVPEGKFDHPCISQFHLEKGPQGVCASSGLGLCLYHHDYRLKL